MKKDQEKEAIMDKVQQDNHSKVMRSHEEAPVVEHSAKKPVKSEVSDEQEREYDYGMWISDIMNHPAGEIMPVSPFIPRKDAPFEKGKVFKNKSGEGYVEPTDYFPNELRKKFALGEYNQDSNEKEVIWRTGFIDDSEEWDYITRTIREMNEEDEVNDNT